MPGMPAMPMGIPGMPMMQMPMMPAMPQMAMVVPSPGAVSLPPLQGIDPNAQMAAIQAQQQQLAAMLQSNAAQQQQKQQQPQEQPEEQSQEEPVDSPELEKQKQAQKEQLQKLQNQLNVQLEQVKKQQEELSKQPQQQPNQPTQQAKGTTPSAGVDSKTGSKPKAASVVAPKETGLAKAEKEIPKCHLHKKPNAKCKFCKKYEDMMKVRAEEEKVAEVAKKETAASGIHHTDQHGKLEITNTKTYGFPPLLQTHILESAHYKSLLKMSTFEQVLDECYEYATSVLTYHANSGTMPSGFFVCLYRFFTLGIDGVQLKKLIDNRDSPFIRCTGFLFIRFGLPHAQFWDWLEEYLLDDEEFQPTPDTTTTIGEFVEDLLMKDKFYDSVLLPRVLGGAKRKLEDLIAPIDQYRRRTKANKEIVDLYRKGSLRVEACSNGDWLEGRSIELLDEYPSRLKVRVRLEDRTEDIVHLGKVILRDSADSYGRDRRDRSRSRSPGRASGSDLTRSRGVSDAELIAQMRASSADKAVTSGKDYARKPLGYKASCALAREQGKASIRLMEEETFVEGTRSSRARALPEKEEKKQEMSLEQKQRMKQLFEKYGVSAPAASPAGGAGYNDVEQVDRMRLG